MSLEFSRRSFLKYSAVAAVAVAGAGLFTGCKDTGDSYNLLCKGAGELTILQVTAGMGYNEETKKYEAPSLAEETVVFPMKVTNNRTNPIYINATNFKVTVTSKDGKTVNKYAGAQYITVESSLYDTNLKKGTTASGKITLTLPEKVAAESTVLLTYCPDLQYNEYSLNWQLTQEADSSSDSSSDSTT